MVCPLFGVAAAAAVAHPHIEVTVTARTWRSSSVMIPWTDPGCSGRLGRGWVGYVGSPETEYARA